MICHLRVSNIKKLLAIFFVTFSTSLLQVLVLGVFSCNLRKSSFFKMASKGSKVDPEPSVEQTFSMVTNILSVKQLPNAP